MSSVDERVVQMQFDNAQFQQGVQQTTASLGKLNQSLQMQGATKGLTDVAAASKNVKLDHISAAVDRISQRFRTMGIVATTAIANIANRAVNAGTNLVKSLTIAPIMKGYQEYELKLGSIQTILANTAHAGTNLKQVTSALNELNKYSDQTIYNFGEMAKNIGTFTAAGVSLDKSTAAIKGIANLAAASGSTSLQASSAMYQLSQAMAAGRATLIDWNSVVNAGMGGKLFQNALMDTARVHGVAIDKMVKDAGGFRNSLEKGWITTGVLTDTLAKFTGDLTAAQLKTMGYNDKQIVGILKMAKIAREAATEVKTFSHLVDTLQEGAGSGWAQTWEIIFGDFEEAKKLWTGVNDVVGGFIERSAEARNKVLGDWKALGGRTVLIEAIKNAFQGLFSILKPIRDAFREVFPPATGQQLYNMTVALRDFTKNLKMGGETADNLKRTFAGIFSVFGIGVDIIVEVAKTLFELFGVATGGSGSFLEITANIGDFLVGLRKAIKEGDLLGKFFGGLGAVLTVPIKAIQFFGKILAALFDNFDGAAAGNAVTGLSAKLEPMGRLGEIIANVWEKVLTTLDDVWNFFQPIANKFGDFFGDFGEKISSAMQGLNFDDVLSGINTGLLAGFVGILYNLIGGGGAGGILDDVGDAIENFGDTLGTLQNTLRATTLLQIALAVGVLAVSMNVLSKIDAAGLTRAGTAIAVLFTQLIGALLIFEKFSGFVGFAKMPFVAVSMILLGTAINVLALAVKQLADLDWNELARGLTGLTVILAGLVLAMKFMPLGGGLIRTSLGLIVLGGAIKVLVSAVRDMAELSWGDIAKGLIGVGALLGGLILFTKFAQANAVGLISGVGIILLATGIKILASAVEQFADLSWGEIARGLVAMAGALVIIGAALYLIPPSGVLAAAGVLVLAMSLGMIGDALKSMGSMSWGEIAKGIVAMAGALVLIGVALGLIPPTALLSAAGVLVVAASLGMIADALKDMGSMSWGEIAKGLVALGGSLALIATAMIFMTGALPGAAALLVVAASLAVLAPVMKMFGEMSWGEIAKGLLMLAGVFVVIGLAGLILTPLVPTLLGLGAAILLIGVGAMAAGVGVFLFAAGLTALAAAGAVGTAALVGMVSAIIGLIPAIAKQLGLGLVAFATAIGSAGPALVGALVKILMSLIQAIDTLIPKIVQTLYKLLNMMLNTMLKYVPRMTDTGLKLLIGIMNGISRNIGRVVASATNLVVRFVNAISNNQPKVIQAGVNMIIKFINGTANAIRSNSARMGAAGANLGMAIVEGMVRGMAGGLGAVTAKARQIAQSALNAAKSALGISSPSKKFKEVGKFVMQGFRQGLDGNKSQVDNAFKNMQKMLVDLAKSSKASRSERLRAVSAYKYLNKYLNDERVALGKLATKYDTYTAKIEAANQVLDDAKKSRDDYKKSVTDQYSDLPEIGNETRLKNYVATLKRQIAETQEFSTMVQELRRLGLSDKIYKELLEKGPTAIPFVRQLLAGGKTSIDEVNKLGAELDRVAGNLGSSASTALYQAAVNAAAGLVKGLEKQRAAIEKQMDKIADYMVKAIKKKLKIKSPSREFAEIGEFAVEGLVEGLVVAATRIEKPAADLGESAMDTLRKALSDISNVVDSEIDMHPTIRPVLDLTQIKKDAGSIGGILPKASLSVGSAYSSAKEVSAAIRSARSSADEPVSTSVPSGLVFNQYNNSPKALSSADIYRQTKNQLSSAKGALPV